MNMTMLPKQLKLVWNKNNFEEKMSLSLVFHRESAVPLQLQSLFKKYRGLDFVMFGLTKRVPFVLLKCEY